MANQTSRESWSCDHCNGKVRPATAQLDADVFRCEKCGCRWDGVAVLVHKGHRCPVHGKEAVRSAVLRIAQWLAEHGDAQPTPTTT